jgi:hypothetical protein
MTMLELLASILVFALAAVGMGVGLLYGRRGIHGSCGGLNRIAGIASDCGGACRRPCRKRTAGPHSRSGQQ